MSAMRVRIRATMPPHPRSEDGFPVILPPPQTVHDVEVVLVDENGIEHPFAPAVLSVTFKATVGGTLRCAIVIEGADIDIDTTAEIKAR